MSETAPSPTKRHGLVTRLWHWLNFASVTVLFMSGLNISNAHRYLYWGHSGFDPSQAWLAVPRFPGWATIPGYYDLAAARDWHILAAWFFAVGLLVMWVVLLFSGRFLARNAYLSSRMDTKGNSALDRVTLEPEVRIFRN